MIEHERLVREYSHERHRPREAEALKSLQKVASMVKPIMRQRGWTVGILAEFYPQETNLLGINYNKGQRICLRLRYPGDQNQFLPFEEVVDTMLHELCHNVHGPHDDVFQKLWNQLRDELEALIRKGYTGEGFLGKGHKLGGSSRIPMDEARRQARAAAERRKTLNAGSGQKVGGRTVRRGEDIRRVIADAAQQRFNITKGCARDNDKQDQIIEEVNRNGFRTQAEEDDANEQAIMQAYMELVQEDEREKYGKDYVAPSRENPTGALGGITPESSRKPTTMRPPPVPSATKPKEKPKEKASEKPEVRREPKPKPQIIPETIPSVDDVWTCEICTLNNQATYLCCEACLTERPEIYIPETRPTVQPSTSSRASNIQSGRSKPTQDQSANTNLRRKESRSNLDKFAEIERNKPLGWTCHRCSTFMEHQWWTCSRCGTMRLSS